jgi:hypothetical protein
MATIDDVLKVVENAEPRTKSVRIPLDPAALDRLADLEQAVKDARRREAQSIAESSTVAEAKAELDAYRLEIEDTAVTFTFRELKRPEWNAVLRACPSTDPRLRWDEDLMGPALIAACCVDPPMQPEQAMRLWGALGNAGAAVLFGTAYELQEVMGRVPFGGNGTAATNGSEPNSTIADPEASPTASS